MSRSPTFALSIGDQAWCLLYEAAGSRSRSGARQTLLGAARVRVDGRTGEQYEVTVIGASPRWYVGRKITKPRTELYAIASRESHREFGDYVRRLWPDSEVNARRSA